VNYVSLGILRVFLCLEYQYEAELAAEARRAKEEAVRRATEAAAEASAWQIFTVSLFDMKKYQFWAWGEDEAEVSQAALTPETEPNCLKLLPSNVVIGTGLILAGWFVTKFSTIRIDRLGSIILLGTFFSTTGGSVILISSLAMESFGRGNHLALCHGWVLYTFMTVAVVAFYLLQRNLLANQEYWKRQRFADLELALMGIEGVLFLLQACVILRYLPAIHPGFNAANSLSLALAWGKTTRLATWGVILPKEVQGVMQVVGGMLGSGWIGIQDYYYAVPESLKSVITTSSENI